MAQPNNTLLLITGAAGFIGSCTVEYLTQLGYNNLVIVDDFLKEAKQANWSQKTYTEKVDRAHLETWLQNNHSPIGAIIHLGARTDTTEFDYSVHEKLNVAYSKMLWSYCSSNDIPFIYASSAATYGDGSLGYNDDHEVPFQLQPLNPYGVSKNEFDKWALQQSASSKAWAGLKFFNVYGPNEYHKGRMASVIWHSFNQINDTGLVKLFKSHKPDFADGQQLRDFVYVKDVVQVIAWLLSNMLAATWNSVNSGLFNLGTGEARSFYDLAANTFKALNLSPNIEFVPMPEDIREKYQYFTEANMQKLRSVGYPHQFYSLEEGVQDYVANYLRSLKIY